MDSFGRVEDCGLIYIQLQGLQRGASYLHAKRKVVLRRQSGVTAHMLNADALDNTISANR
jgi:hypothetical protein